MKKLRLFEENYTKLKGHFEMISKFNLRFGNTTYEFEIHFKMTPIPNSPTTTLMFRLLYPEYLINHGSFRHTSGVICVYGLPY